MYFSELHKWKITRVWRLYISKKSGNYWLRSKQYTINRLFIREKVKSNCFWWQDNRWNSKRDRRQTNFIFDTTFFRWKQFKKFKWIWLNISFTKLFTNKSRVKSRRRKRSNSNNRNRNAYENVPLQNYRCYWKWR